MDPESVWPLWELATISYQMHALDLVSAGNEIPRITCELVPASTLQTHWRSCVPYLAGQGALLAGKVSTVSPEACGLFNLNAVSYEPRVERTRKAPPRPVIHASPY